MTEKEAQCIEELEKCRANIVKTKGKIEFHKDMLKKFEHKELELVDKLEKIKLYDLKALISTQGYNIDDLREAMIAGDLSGIVPQKPDNVLEECSEKSAAENALQQEQISKSDDEIILSDDNKNSLSEMDNKS